MDQYRTPPSALTRHDAGRWAYGRQWITALNSGDATGAAYLATATPLAAPNAPARLSAAARRAFERQYATVEITDSVAMMGGHQVGLMRGYYGELQRAVDALERDVLNSGSSYHEMTAILDKVAAGELLGTPAGHGDEPTAVARARATAREEQEATGYGSVDAQHAARHVEGRRRRESRISRWSGSCPRHLAPAIGGV